MNDARLRARISLTKCWQTDDGVLVFQCSLRNNDADERKKGFLIINPSDRSDVISFNTEKPSYSLSTKGLASLVRKHCPTAQLMAVALNPDGSLHNFIRVKLRTPETGKEIFIVASTKPKHEIDFVIDGYSLARLRPRSSFTVRKKALDVYLTPKDFDNSGFQTWVYRLGASSQASSQSSSDKSTPGLSAARKSARDKISRRIKTLRKTLEQDLKKIPSKNDIENAKRQSHLLKSYLWLVKPGMFSLNLDAARTGDFDTTIDLLPELSPGENLERLFKRAKRLERASTLQGERAAKLKLQIHTFEQALAQIRDDEKNLSDNAVTDILVSLGLKQAPKIPLSRNTASAKKTWLGRRFLSRSGALMTLGRDSVESDKLVKAAKSNDWWIHIAGGGHGGHVIVSNIPPKNPLPDATLRESAILALHFSDRSASCEGEVYCTKRQFIRKPKGLAPGLWLVDKANTVLVRYEPEELAELFSQEIRDGISRHQE